jgi:hypothetical protein
MLTVLTIPYDNPASFTQIEKNLRGMQNEVGGLIEHINLLIGKKKYILVVNEEGRLKDLPVNKKATFLLGKSFGNLFDPATLTVIVGDCFLVGATANGYKSIAEDCKDGLLSHVSDEVVNEWWAGNGEKDVEAALKRPLFRIFSF